MSEAFKVSGKKVPLPEPGSVKWEFEWRPGGWIIASSSTGVRKRILIHESKGRLSAHLQGVAWNASPVVQTHGSGGVGRGSDSDLVAQFPGKVRKLLVVSGAVVAQGDSLLLVEAMKMEFVIRAPFPGQVKQLLVKEGDQISPGDRFVDLQESPKK